MPKLIFLTLLDAEEDAFVQTDDTFIEALACFRLGNQLEGQRNTSDSYYNPTRIQRGLSRFSYFLVRSEAFRFASTLFLLLLVLAAKDFRA